MGKEYSMDDPEFWTELAETIGYDHKEIEDDSEFVDENGVVIKEWRSSETSPANTQESKFDDSITPTIYYFTNKENGQVEAIHMYSIFGISTMDQSIQDWRPASREDKAVSDFIYGSHNIFDYNWDSEPYSVNDPNWDPEDLQDWYPSAAKSWAKGETVTEDDLAPYAKRLDSNFVIDANEPEED
jgi:hypothetical protein